MKVYRIYTEDKNSYLIEKLLERHGIDGATIYETTGLWQGKSEASIVIEIIGHDSQDVRARVFALKDDIKRENNQESVLLTISQAEVYF